jgi:hypothetical protein
LDADFVERLRREQKSPLDESNDVPIWIADEQQRPKRQP